MRFNNVSKRMPWPGISSWFLSFLGVLAVFELFAAFAWRGEQGRLPDLTTAIITIPGAFIVIVLAAAAVLRVMARIPVENTLVWIVRMLPIAWAFPVFDLIRTYGKGLVVTTPLLDGNALLSAVFTGGLLPLESGISVGMRLGIFAAVLSAGLVVWFATHRVARSVVGGLTLSAVCIGLISITSVSSLVYRLLHGLGWTAIRNEVARSAVSAVSNGYWWNALYERFPAVVESQATIALRLTEAGVIMFALGLFLIILFFWIFPTAGRLIRHAFWAWGALNTAVYATAGFVVALVLARPPTFSLSWVLAFGIAVFAMIALRFSSVMRRNLNRLRDDEARDADQPIVRGELSVAEAKDASAVCEWYALAAGWVLGWPVFAMFLVYLAASHLTRGRSWPSSSFMPTLYRSAGAAALAMAGLLFGSQESSLGPLALALAVLAATHRIFAERGTFLQNRI
ncbi:hypothetical protein HS096_01550 [candidate division WWE3 bacterium]|uniref:Uncharacterized protein n=1 Tax=candidate division WWE3 bacterium TaxID=2053526 RepID=A0A928TVB5_UNCKA|nr:hypothetical protein [candidate division WWE3 bacterium]